MSNAAGAFAKLTDLVAKLLPNADTDTIQIVAATAGLLAHIAYSDRDFSPAERDRIRALMGRVQGISDRGAEAIVRALEQHVIEISTVEAPRCTRALSELADRDLRYEVLKLLVEAGAADHELSAAEVQRLRQVTTALALSQADYNELQAAHRDKLAALKS